MDDLVVPQQNRKLMFTTQSVLLFLMGSLTQVLSYGSIQPMVIGCFTFLFGLALMRVTFSGGRYENSAYNLIFSIGWFWAGIAAIYSNQLNDYLQNFSDASSFFELASGISKSVSLEDLKVITEGSGALVLWRAIYKA